MFIYKHSEANEYVRNLQTSNLLVQLQIQLHLKILKIKKKKKLLGCCFYMKTNIYGDFQI